VPRSEGEACSGGCWQRDVACPSGSTVCDEASGLYCNIDTHECTASGLEGMPCDRNRLCRSGLACYEDVCTSRREQGPCDGFSGICAVGSRCDSVTSECTPDAQLGEPCEASWCVGTCTNGICEHRYAVDRVQCSGP
jgi:hypothetical protein